MTAPDPGLTDLIAAALYSVLAKAAKSGTATVDDLVASVTPVVEQHTNGRMAELYEQRDNAIEAGLAAIARAEKAEATNARVRGEVNAYSEIIPVVALADLRAALEGEQR